MRRLNAEAYALDSLAASSRSFAASQSSGGKGETDIYHFVSYVPVDGFLYELDGLSRGPRRLGKGGRDLDGGLGDFALTRLPWWWWHARPAAAPCTEANWLEVATPILKERMHKSVGRCSSLWLLFSTALILPPGLRYGKRTGTPPTTCTLRYWRWSRTGGPSTRPSCPPCNSARPTFAPGRRSTARFVLERSLCGTGHPRPDLQRRFFWCVQAADTSMAVDGAEVGGTAPASAEACDKELAAIAASSAALRAKIDEENALLEAAKVGVGHGDGPRASGACSSARVVGGGTRGRSTRPTACAASTTTSRSSSSTCRSWPKRAT